MQAVPAISPSRASATIVEFSAILTLPKDIWYLCNCVYDLCVLCVYAARVCSRCVGRLVISRVSFRHTRRRRWRLRRRRRRRTQHFTNSELAISSDTRVSFGRSGEDLDSALRSPRTCRLNRLTRLSRFGTSAISILCDDFSRIGDSF